MKRGRLPIVKKASMVKKPSPPFPGDHTLQISNVSIFIFLPLYVLLAAGFHPAQAQYIPGQLSNEAEISILTLGPAEPAYTIFGHTAIRLQDSTNNIDQVYNYGTFNTNETNFYLKFLYGNIRYSLSATSFQQFKQTNTALGRSIINQTLNLTPSEVNRLARQLEQNLLPENRSYQYRFFTRNCVTQVQDLFSEKNLGHSFGQMPTPVLSTSTYRQKITPYLVHRPWLHLAINLMLGANADKNDNQRQHFLPDDLHLFLANVTDSSGERAVQSSQTIAKAEIMESNISISPRVLFWGLFLIVIAFTTISLVNGWQGWWLDRILFGAVGLAGLIIAFGSLVSLHSPLHNNWNLLWALPTHLVVTAGMPLLNHRWIQTYFLTVLTLGILVIVGWTFIPQQVPIVVIPVIGVIIIRSTYRVFMAAVAKQDQEKTELQNDGI